MKLFTKEIDKQLFAQYSLGNDLKNQKVVAKIFNPYGRGTWYIINSDPNDPDYLWAIVDLYEIEVGSVSRKDLENLKVPPFGLPLERDMYYTPVNAANLYRDLIIEAEDKLTGESEGERRAGMDDYKHGGKIDIAEQNKEMLLNYAEELEHHTEEFEEAAKKAKNVEPWVVAKMERSTTDLSDVTHYLDSENEKRREYEDGEGEENEDTESMKKGGKTESEELVYIEYFNKDKKFAKDRKEFKGDNAYKEAISWGRKNIGNFNADMVKFKMANGGVLYENMRQKETEIKFKIALIIGIDTALEYLNKDFIVSPFQLIKSAVFKGFITVDEINQNIWDAAVSESYDIEEDYRDSGYGIGSSDMNAFIYRMLRGAGIDVQVVNNRYQRMAKGGQMGIDKHKIYFSNLAEVIDAINDIASENGYEVAEIFPDLSYGGISYGQTKKVKVDLKWNGKEKVGKSKRRETNTLNVSIYRMDSGNYELVSYFSYEEGGMMADGGEIKSLKSKLKNSDNEIYIDGNNLKIQKKDNPINFLTIRQVGKDLYDVDVTSGTIQEPSKRGNATWYNLGNKYHSYNELVGILNRYGIKKMADGGMMAKGGVSENLDMYINYNRTKPYEYDKVTNMNTLNALQKNGLIEFTPITGKDTLYINGQTNKTYISRDRDIKSAVKPSFSYKNIDYFIGYEKGINYLKFYVLKKGNDWDKYNKQKMASGGKVKFTNKVKPIKSSLLKRKKVSPSVQKDYGKTYSPKEAEESAKPIVGAMTAKERLMKKRKK
jgi:hypothetical protein